MEKTSIEITNQILRWKQPMISITDLKNRVSRRSLWIWIIPTAWNNPDGDSQCASGCMTFVMGWIRAIVVFHMSQTGQARCYYRILTMKPGRSSPLLWDWSGPQTFPYCEKMKWSWSDQRWWISAAHRAGIRSILPSLGRAWLDQDDQLGAWTPLSEASGRKIWSDCIQKRNLRMEELFCIGCGASIQTENSEG